MDTSSLLLEIWQEVNPNNMATLHWAVQYNLLRIYYAHLSV